MPDLHVSSSTVVIGGGLAGLTATALLARGRSVTLFESAHQLGGRAATLRRDGFLFNQGIHAFYLGGSGEAVLRELGVPLAGRHSDRKRYDTDDGERLTALPVDRASIEASPLLNAEAKAELGILLSRLAEADADRWRGVTMREWVTRCTSEPMVRRWFHAVASLATYDASLDHIDAGHALELIGHARPALLLDGGWQTLVDALERVARSAGARIITGARVTAVERAGRGYRVHLLGRDAQEADSVILAVEPQVAARLVAGGQHDVLRDWAEQALPQYAACLDVALERLPVPNRVAVLALDRSRFYSIHSEWSLLAPPGGALVHLVQYKVPGDRGSEADRVELEAWLDRLQPGWRDVEVARQFLPRMRVSSDAVRAARGGPGGRPGPAVPRLPGLFVAGDWVGQEDHLANASLASARRAASLILAGTAVPA